MPITTTNWTADQVGEALGIVPQAASRKMSGLERRLRTLAAASAALDPSLRPCDLAGQLLALVRAAGRLERFDAAGLAAWIDTIVRDELSSPHAPASTRTSAAS